MNKKTIKDLELNNKVVLMRLDFNVPINKDLSIGNDNRIKASLPSINYVIEQGGKAVIFSHLGRIKEEGDKETKSLNNVAKKLGELLNKEVIFVNETRGSKLEEAIKNMKESDVLVVENTRFEDLNDKAESKNSEDLGKYWAGLGDVFVNDAFGTAHRSHASNVGIATHIKESAVGFLIEKEINFIGTAVNSPKKPLVVILGGSKVSDKISVIENLIDKADKILIGGGMTYTFLKAQGLNIGTSLCEDDKIPLAKELLERANGKIILPVDSVVNTAFSNEGAICVRGNEEMQDNEMGLDIGTKSLEIFKSHLETAKTVLWNGPMGVFEMSNFAKGTIGICEILESLDAITIIGGGDSAAAAIENGFEEKMSHISTGGGASLEFIEGKTLPGIESIQNK